MKSSKTSKSFDKIIDEDKDEELVEMNLLLSGSISPGIPWADFSEVELQTILKIHFERLGFDIVWRHRDDPASEAGVDLECRSEQRRVLVAVKKRPKKEALAQVVELSNEPADQRVYVYIGGASQSFRDQQASFADRVEFWDETTLEKRLNESELTRIVRCDNSLANQAILKIMLKLADAIKTKPPPGVLPRPSPELIETLWGMKDRSVTLHECASMIKLMFEDSKRVGQLDYDQIQNLIMWCLDHLYAAALLSLRHTFEALSPELKTLLYKVHETTRVRSNWLYLFSYAPGIMPGRVSFALKDYEKAKAEEREIEQKVRSISIKRDSAGSNTTFHSDEISREFSSLAIWGYAMEATIDDLFEKCLKGRVRH